MVITYFGDGCLRLQSGETSLLVDSTNNRLKGDVVLKTIVASSESEVQPNEVAFAGEYEIAGMEIRGWGVPGESSEKFVKTVYRVDWEDMSFVFLGHLSKGLDADTLENLGDPDVLIVPVGGGHFLEPDVAAKLVKQIEAKIVIPTFAKSPAEFLKAMGQKIEAQEKLVFKKKDIGAGVSGVVVLTPAT